METQNNKKDLMRKAESVFNKFKGLNAIDVGEALHIMGRMDFEEACNFYRQILTERSVAAEQQKLYKRDSACHTKGCTYAHVTNGSPCRYGSKCRKMDSCPFKHPPQPQFAISIAPGKCRYDTICRESDCPFFHSTPSGNSPASNQ
jgi:hypothetical protein